MVVIARAFIQTGRGCVAACGFDPNGLPYVAQARVISVGESQEAFLPKTELWKGGLVYSWTFGGVDGRPSEIDYLLSRHLRECYHEQLGAIATHQMEREFYKRVFDVVARPGFEFLLFPRNK